VRLAWNHRPRRGRSKTGQPAEPTVSRAFRPASSPNSTAVLTTVLCLPTHASLAFLHATHAPTAYLQHASTHFPPTYMSLCISSRARTRPHSTRPSRLSPSLLPLCAGRRFRLLHCDVGHSLGQGVCVVLPRTPGSAVLRAALARHVRARHGRGYHEWPEPGPTMGIDFGRGYFPSEHLGTEYFRSFRHAT